jgi:hypothetical protein
VLLFVFIIRIGNFTLSLFTLRRIVNDEVTLVAFTSELNPFPYIGSFYQRSALKALNFTHTAIKLILFNVKVLREHLRQENKLALR